MKALALFILLFVSVPIVSAQPVVVIVRHAEKANGGNDPDLSSAGRARANELARILKDSGITAIFSTEFKRTQETATHWSLAMATQFRTLSKRLESIAR